MCATSRPRRGQEDAGDEDGCVSRFWRHPTKRRYYRVRLETDLFGHWILRRVWGSLDSRRGAMRCQFFPTRQAGAAAIKAVAARRKRHGYTEVLG